MKKKEEEEENMKAQSIKIPDNFVQKYLSHFHVFLRRRIDLTCLEWYIEDMLNVRRF